MKPTDAEFAAAVLNMGDVIPWFPESAESRDLIARAMSEFVGSVDGLLWLTTCAIRDMKDWKKWGGIPALREMYNDYLRLIEQEEDERKMISWRAEKRKELAAGGPVSERPQVVPIREPNPKPKAQPWPDPKVPREDWHALEEPDPDHPGQWRLKNTGVPTRSPEEYSRELQQLQTKLEELHKQR